MIEGVLSNGKGRYSGRTVMLTAPSNSLAVEILKLKISLMRVVVGLLTGHCNPRNGLPTIGINKDEPICRFCNEEGQTTFHIIFECVTLEN